MNDQSIDRRLALFDIDEIQKGKHLGSGGFNEVYEVCGFHSNLKRNSSLKRSHAQAREMLKQHVRSETTGETRFAIKYLKNQWDDQDAFETAALDLATEAELLSSINHPNILKLRGLATNGLDSFATMERIDGFFIILDRLEETLADKIAKWHKQTKSSSTNMKTRMEQLKRAFEIASALEYLHKEGIIYRDLKPENIGIDLRDNTKIFDFGLAREMPEAAFMDDLFEMSGKIGTARYMAPEVYLREAYNEKADVYSFAHVLWEILATEKPYDGFTKHMHRERVIKKGSRPSIDPAWPFSIHFLLKTAWDADIQKRPTMADIRMILETEYLAVKRICSNEQLNDSRRRRASVFNWSSSTLSLESDSEHDYDGDRDDDIISISGGYKPTRCRKPHHSIDKETMTNEPRARAQRRNAIIPIINHFVGSEVEPEQCAETVGELTRIALAV